jgi:hypothetical protein
VESVAIDEGAGKNPSTKKEENEHTEQTKETSRNKTGVEEKGTADRRRNHDWNLHHKGRVRPRQHLLHRVLAAPWTPNDGCKLNSKAN